MANRRNWRPLVSEQEPVTTEGALDSGESFIRELERPARQEPSREQLLQLDGFQALPKLDRLPDLEPHLMPDAPVVQQEEGFEERVWSYLDDSAKSSVQYLSERPSPED